MNETAVRHIKPPVPEDQFDYKNLKQGEFWRHIPAYKDVDEATFLDHLWQQKNAVKTAGELLATIKDVCSPEFYADAAEGFARAPMAVRVSPYAISLIDWNDPIADPIRRQFVPLGSTLLPDHPRLTLDSLHEQDDSPVPGLVHRYVDKALFLPLNTCPVYCRFCTRSYAIGPDTENVDKVALAKTPKQWQDAFAYIAERPELEDIVISGGDAYQLPPKNIELIGNALLDIPHVRRMRFATKGPAIMPMKLITHTEWLDAVTASSSAVASSARKSCFTPTSTRPKRSRGSPRRRCECSSSGASSSATNRCSSAASTTTARRMQLLVKRLGHLNVHPYYVYMHDMVKGVEDLRTTIGPLSTSRSSCAAARPASTRRPSSATRPAAAASATCTRTSTTIARTASPCTPHRASNPARPSSTSIRSTSSRPTRRRAGPSATFKIR